MIKLLLSSIFGKKPDVRMGYTPTGEGEWVNIGTEKRPSWVWVNKPMTLVKKRRRYVVVEETHDSYGLYVSSDKPSSYTEIVECLSDSEEEAAIRYLSRGYERISKTRGYRR